jgi:hypothetical protein
LLTILAQAVIPRQEPPMITWAKDPRMKARNGEEWVGLIFIGEHPPTRDRSLSVLPLYYFHAKKSRGLLLW